MLQRINLTKGKPPALCTKASLRCALCSPNPRFRHASTAETALGIQHLYRVLEMLFGLFFGSSLRSGCLDPARAKNAFRPPPPPLRTARRRTAPAAPGSRCSAWRKSSGRQAAVSMRREGGCRGTVGCGVCRLFRDQTSVLPTIS